MPETTDGFDSIDECLALPPEQARKAIGNSVSMLAQL